MKLEQIIVFSVTVTNVSDNSTVSDLAFSTTLQSAQDSQFTVNGLQIERDSNSVDDVVTGLTFSFTEVTSSPVTIDSQEIQLLSKIILLA